MSDINYERELVSDFNRFSQGMDIFRGFFELGELYKDLTYKILDFDYSEVASYGITKEKVANDLSVFDFGEFILFYISKIILNYRSDHIIDKQLFSMLTSGFSKREAKSYYTVNIAKKTKKYKMLNEIYETNPIKQGTFLWKFGFYLIGTGLNAEYELFMKSLIQNILAYADLDLDLDEEERETLAKELEGWKLKF